jgi:hypothetical protein
MGDFLRLFLETATFFSGCPTFFTCSRAPGDNPGRGDLSRGITALLDSHSRANPQYLPFCRLCHKDARWTKKHGKSFYGYKNHVNAERIEPGPEDCGPSRRSHRSCPRSRPERNSALLMAAASGLRPWPEIPAMPKKWSQRSADHPATSSQHIIAISFGPASSKTPSSAFPVRMHPQVSPRFRALCKLVDDQELEKS